MNKDIPKDAYYACGICEWKSLNIYLAIEHAQREHKGREEITEKTMKQSYKIDKKRDKPFTGDDGEKVPYFWYSATRGDGVKIQFGTSNGLFEVGQVVELELEKRE